MATKTNTFLHNFFHLSLLRAISHFPQLIYIPFLIQAIGVNEYGILEIWKVITMYFTTFVSYGFRYAATKQITVHQQDKGRIGQIISSIYFIQLIFIVISALVMWGVIRFVPQVQSNSIYLVNFFPIVITSGLFPTFIFQGINMMRWLVGINLSSKLLFIGSVLFFIHEPADAIWFPRFLAGTDFFRLLVSWLVLYGYKDIPIKYPLVSIMKQQLKEGSNIFFSQLANLFYGRFPVMFLGFFVSPEAGGIYTLGEKINKFTEGMLEPAMQALYPISHSKLDKNLNQGLRYLGRFCKTGFAILLCVGVIYFVFADFIMWFFLKGKHIPEAVQVFKIQAFVAAIVLLHNVLGMHVLIPLQKGYLYTAAILVAGVVAVGLHLILIPRFATEGAAGAVVLSELFTLLLVAINAYRTVKKARLKNDGTTHSIG